MAVSKFLWLGILITFLRVIISLNNGRVEASHKVYPQFQSLNAVNVQQLHRTGYHFQPPNNWINGTIITPILHSTLFKLFPFGGLIISQRLAASLLYQS
ncbi:hypothetical protein CRYUN_Cryun08bG0124800 [Craigia yunnanensis]